ncbi:INO80 complex, subunit Ies4 [Macrophomina phaseolina]|uniref:INO80 complex, subunit Ies4 n=1 Tax=Macrophomina phaseolina TaxID=35725 RepID=A0ABQ8GW70_9PEZI|nr:INO80 complex, subunit Ies4 [Macrophomina phaseolina]
MSAKSPRSALAILRLPPAKLAQFLPDGSARKNSRSKSSSSSTPVDTLADPMVIEPAEPQPALDGDSASALNGSTPALDNNSLAPPQNGVKRKGVPGPKPGSKRTAGQSNDGTPKPRGKPGPKKKPRIGDNGDTPTNGVIPMSTQKLGPKANQGAINAGLRALDRSGKPCRKWEKKGFQLKSFTGISWSVPTWRAPRRTTVDENGDVKSDTTGTSDTAKVNESSAVPSEKSSNPGAMDTPNRSHLMINAASSPIPEMTPV